MIDDVDIGPDRLDERRRFSSQEWWYLEAVNGPGSLGLVTEVLVDAASGVGRFWFVAWLGDRVVAVVDNDLPVPATGLEVRTSGLWFEYRCQHDAELFTVDLEAFGLEVDAGTVIDDTTYGHRVPVGCELEWISDDRSVTAISDGYYLDAVVEGVLLVGAAELAVVGTGQRCHRWGATRVDGFGAPTPDRSGLRSVAALLEPAGNIVEFLVDPAGRWCRRNSGDHEGLR